MDGKSTSVSIRSILPGLPFSISHAFKPSATAATAQKTDQSYFHVQDHTYIQLQVLNFFPSKLQYSTKMKRSKYKSL